MTAVRLRVVLIMLKFILQATTALFPLGDFFLHPVEEITEGCLHIVKIIVGLV